jgi:hypothetical protein
VAVGGCCGAAVRKRSWSSSRELGPHPLVESL